MRSYSHNLFLGILSISNLIYCQTILYTFLVEKMYNIVMRKIFSILLVILFISSPLLASPGGLDQNGGHYCRKNCSKYGLKTGQYHCHRSYCKIKK